MSNFYKQLVTALQSVLTCIQYMVTRANTSFSSNAVKHKQLCNCIASTGKCMLEVVNVCILHHGIDVVVICVVWG